MQVTVDDAVHDLYLAHFPGVYSGKENLAEIGNLAAGKDRRYLAYFDEDGGLDPDRYFQPKLLGGTLEYDEDLSEAHCGCDAALYLVRMPALYSDGSPNPTDGYYYCGSQYGRQVCPEFDVMEANLYSWRTNGHACDPPSDTGYYEHCDSSAKCGVDQVHYAGFGPGASLIDTNAPFHTRIDFKAVVDGGEGSDDDAENGE